MNRTSGFALLLVVFTIPCASAQEADDVFSLGQITITGQRPEPLRFGNDVVGREEIWTFDTQTLDQSMKLVPGVTATLDSNGRRNERDVFVRGYGRWQVPLSIDGVRIYLPADNRIDFNRFLTSDLAEIQVAKGYVSVIDGPGAMGGAINLVTRKPTQRFEAELEGGALLGGDASTQGWNGYAMVGGRGERWYAQASVAALDRDHWTLSDDFVPVSAAEDGGDRNSSDNRDSRINAKVGFMPNDTDEYSISYTKQEGEKGAPLNVNNSPPIPPNSYWRWPWWDIQNLYWLSSTALGSDGAYLKTKLYYNRFENALDAFDDATYTTQSTSNRFRSYYDDDSTGASVEFGVPLGTRNDSRFAAHYRRDEHREHNVNQPTNPQLAHTEPVQRTREDTLSFAAENTWHARESLDLLVGISYDRNEILQAQEYNAMQGVLFDYPVGSSDAWNGQASLQWRYDEGAILAASMSSRTRFPTTFERYSTRFGTAVPNPDLGPERGINYELSWRASPGTGASVSAALFYADVRDMIQTVIVATTPEQLTQTQNVGDGEYYGVELAGDASIGTHWRLGGNYTWLHRQIRDALRPGLVAIGTPTHQAFLFATWSPIEALSFTPSLEYASDRWSEVAGSTSFVQVGEYLLVNLQAQWNATERIVLAIGARNLADENFELSDGLPEPGRTLYAKLQVGF